jgi:alpha-L-rhamnosidase
MMGSIDAWFYKYIAGIQINETNSGFSSFVIKPHLLSGLTYVEGKTETIRGTVASRWKTEPGKFTIEVEIPFNTSARVFVPGAEKAEIVEGVNPLKNTDGIEYIGYSAGWHELKVNSGKYNFIIKPFKTDNND